MSDKKRPVTDAKAPGYPLFGEFVVDRRSFMNTSVIGAGAILSGCDVLDSLFGQRRTLGEPMPVVKPGASATAPPAEGVRPAPPAESERPASDGNDAVEAGGGEGADTPVRNDPPPDTDTSDNGSPGRPVDDDRRFRLKGRRRAPQPPKPAPRIPGGKRPPAPPPPELPKPPGDTEK